LKYPNLYANKVFVDCAGKKKHEQLEITQIIPSQTGLIPIPCAAVTSNGSNIPTTATIFDIPRRTSMEITQTNRTRRAG